MSLDQFGADCRVWSVTRLPGPFQNPTPLLERQNLFPRRHEPFTVCGAGLAGFGAGNFGNSALCLVSACWLLF